MVALEAKNETLEIMHQIALQRLEVLTAEKKTESARLEEAVAWAQEVALEENHKAASAAVKLRRSIDPVEVRQRRALSITESKSLLSVLDAV